MLLYPADTVHNPNYLQCENGGKLLTDGWWAYLRKPVVFFFFAGFVALAKPILVELLRGHRASVWLVALLWLSQPHCLLV